MPDNGPAPAALAVASESIPEPAILALATVMVLACVGIHYEILLLAYRGIARSRLPHRPRVAVGILIAMSAHLAEVVAFTWAWALLVWVDAKPLSIVTPTATDLLYFSFSTYSSLGYGDIVPIGAARLLAGIEAVTGLVLIAWTASFTFFEMQRNWQDD